MSEGMCWAVLVSRAQGFQGGIGLVIVASQAQLGTGLGLSPLGSEESLQDVKQVNPGADLYVRSCTG